MDILIEEVKKCINIIFVDFYVEIISEKEVMGWYLDGCVMVVVGMYIYV